MILRNKTNKDNFLIVSKIFLQDQNLSLVERGLLATMHSFPDKWDFTVRGMCKILPDGETRIATALSGLEKKGYVRRRQSKKKTGKYGHNIIEIYERPIRQNPVTENPVTAGPLTEEPVAEKRTEYNIQTYKTNQSSTDPSIHQAMTEGMIDIDGYKKLVAKNIELENLLKKAGPKGDYEIDMVHEIYDVICDMVCFPREKVVIDGATYPWTEVKSRYLQLRYCHVAAILNRLIDKSLNIKKMSAYLVTSLYKQSLVGVMEMEASIHDDYLKYLRGNPYD